MILTSHHEQTISDLLKPETIRMNLKGKTKQEIIDELIDTLDVNRLLLDRDRARNAVMERERQVSTGLENGIAVPHGKTDAVEKLVAVFGIHRDGVMFDSSDKLPSFFFFMMISPLTETGPHLKALRDVIRVFSPDMNRKQILNAATPAEIIGIIRDFNKL